MLMRDEMDCAANATCRLLCEFFDHLTPGALVMLPLQDRLRLEAAKVAADEWRSLAEPWGADHNPPTADDFDDPRVEDAIQRDMELRAMERGCVPC